MIRFLAVLTALLLLTACSASGGVHPDSPPPAEVAQQAPKYKDWQPPVEEAAVPWNYLPDEVRLMFIQHGDSSPDGQWMATLVFPRAQMSQLWLADSQHTTARLVQHDFSLYDAHLWSPRGTSLYWRSMDDSWQEVDPVTGGKQPFLPNLLTGQKAGMIQFSPSGERLLFTTGLCYCNRPTPWDLTAYVANMDGTGQERLGVNVDARWDGDTIVITPLARP